MDYFAEKICFRFGGTWWTERGGGGGWEGAGEGY